MLKYLLPIMASSTLIISATSYADDEYEYITTPLATQIDDLQDDDRDGVINARDLCPDTPLRSDIDNDGCGTYIKTEEQLQLRILFANDSADINPVFRGQIRSMSEFLKQYPSTSIELQGYASKVGSAEYNLALSKKRAYNVENTLISYGISQSRIRIVGFGDTNVAESGDDEVSHAMNRKVIATVVGHKGSIKEEWSIFTKREQ
ncbi:OmpA family protein [Vibrio aestuarianus]|uniref:OmpA family protein n=1 Tax=Vibrio aestuarianus TaxID=28171 RepID=A0A9X4J3M2_9VIBR|nr:MULTISPECIES: OmpA family protein [Vibrio]MDE1235413.1 OmpA family protein [Vibrio aestuarianus]MDE1246291.1 OmpA family protein [Vibrio aestuarianus]MDE1265493.1 OmpA family protein [Vibrio aestuarianus]MDE1297712.1 OmpA family protein [Vibrio aestuarianus]MDE1311161.1 OmpA family protein [Vibrio aestuarianus]